LVKLNLSLEMKCKMVSWDEVYQFCKILAKKVEESGFKPETIIGLARSGFVPSRLLSDFLGITDLVCLKVEHWLDTTGEHKDEATIPYRVPFKIEGKKVLVVDDIVDTGKSMDASINYIKMFKPKEVKSAVMQYITSSQHVPNYWVIKVTDWTWFIYPWNKVEDLCNLTLRLLKKSEKGLSLHQIKNGFKEKFGLEIDVETLSEITETLRKRGKACLVEGLWKSS